MTRRLADPHTGASRRPRLISQLDQINAALRGRCEICGASLTDPSSVARSMGPTCAGKHPVVA